MVERHAEVIPDYLRALGDEYGGTVEPYHDYISGDAISGDARYVHPELVGEGEYRSRTTEGYLRHPRWKGLRVDKTVADLDRVTLVRKPHRTGSCRIPCGRPASAPRSAHRSCHLWGRVSLPSVRARSAFVAVMGTSGGPSVISRNSAPSGPEVQV